MNKPSYTIPYSQRSHYLVFCVDDSSLVDPRYCEIRTYIYGFKNAQFVEIRSWQGVR